jgi:Protein of unknown function (DUF2806)
MSDKPPIASTAIANAIEKLVDAVKGPIGDISKPIAKMLETKSKSFDKIQKVKTDIKVEVLKLKHEDWKEKWAERRENNIQTAISNAIMVIIDSVDEDVPKNEELPNEDWMYRFFDDMKDIGDLEMLQIWGKILAGEVATPGKYSLVTLATMKTMTKREAEIFTKLCSCVWRIGNEIDLLTLIGVDERRGYLPVDDLLRLDLHGLIQYSVRSIPFHQASQVSYFDKTFSMPRPSLVPNLEEDLKTSLRRLPFVKTQVILSPVGEELLGIANGEPDYDYMNEIIKVIREFSPKIDEIIDN